MYLLLIPYQDCQPHGEFMPCIQYYIIYRHTWMIQYYSYRGQNQCIETSLFLLSVTQTFLFGHFIFITIIAIWLP